MSSSKKNIKNIESAFRNMIKPLKKAESQPIVPQGTPPADMNPLLDDEWWSICRDDTAPGIPHPGIPGCFECYTMCASHPAVTDPSNIATCMQKAVIDCVIPEIGDIIQGFVDIFVPTETCYFGDNQLNIDTWQSDTCRDPIACSQECQRFCPTQGFTRGQCETAGSMYYCNCS